MREQVQLYLGSDAEVVTGDCEGEPGYWVSAYRIFTPAMIEDMKEDSKAYEVAMGWSHSVGIQDSGASIQCPTPPSDGSEVSHDGQEEDDDNMEMSEDDTDDVFVAS